MKLTWMTLAALAFLNGPAGAQNKQDRPTSPDGTVPLTSNPEGPAKAALPEQDASPKGTTERPGSAASQKAEEIK